MKQRLDQTKTASSIFLLGTPKCCEYYFLVSNITDRLLGTRNCSEYYGKLFRIL